MERFGVPQLYKDIHIEKYNSRAAADMPHMHSHAFHELYFLISGERRYFLGHEIYDMNPGELVVIPCNVLHRTTALNKKGYERYVVYFQERYIDGLISSIGREAFDELLKMGCVEFSKEGSDFITQSLIRLESELGSENKYSEAVQKNIFEQILLYILRHGNKKKNERKKDTDKIQEAAKYISKNYYKEISLSDIASKAFMEETYFSKKFKQMTGFGFKEYLVMTRIKAAQQLLLTTDKSIGEISELCGFTSSNYFGDAFRRFYGKSPSKYRDDWGRD